MDTSRRTLYVDMDNVLVDFASAFPHLTDEERIKYADRYDDVPGIFSKMQPMKGAIQAFEELCGLFDTYLLSTAPWENPSAWSDKLLWVKKHLGNYAYKRLILSHNKHLNRGDFIIDDRTRHGVDRFDGQHIHFGQEAFPDWESVLVYLRKHAT